MAASVVVNTHGPRTREVEAGRSGGIHDHPPWLPSKFEASLSSSRQIPKWQSEDNTFILKNGYNGLAASCGVPWWPVLHP